MARYTTPKSIRLTPEEKQNVHNDRDYCDVVRAVAKYWPDNKALIMKFTRKLK